MSVRARITDKTGTTFLTPPVDGLKQHRPARGFRMVRMKIVPERWESRNGKESQLGILELTEGDLANATFAKMLLTTWSGNVNDTSQHELRLNGQPLAARFGEFHNYDLDILEVPLSRLKVGENTISTYSTFKGHAFEINWPGPALLIEYIK